MKAYKLSDCFTLKELALVLDDAEPALSGNKEFTFFEFSIVMWVAMKLILKHVSNNVETTFTEEIFYNDNLYSAV